MEIAGYIGAIVMGIALGMMGGGGSILTVPILVYLFKIDMEMATAYSLFVVGLSGLIGSIGHMRMGNIHWKAAFVFGIPSLVSIYLTRSVILPAIPRHLITIGSLVIDKPLAMLLLFAVIMLLASWSMIRKGTPKENADTDFNHLLMLIEGIIVGTVTGLVGVGGGFMIIPALVLLAGIPMKKAIGTSLMIIAVNSLTGFIGDLQGPITLDWTFLFRFSLAAITGIIIGTTLSGKIPNEKLKPAFGWFILLMGLYIILKEAVFF